MENWLAVLEKRQFSGVKVYLISLVTGKKGTDASKKKKMKLFRKEVSQLRYVQESCTLN